MRENVWHVTALIIMLGVITLAEDLDIDSVTEFFIRINSKGVVLSQADFAMSRTFLFLDRRGYRLCFGLVDSSQQRVHGIAAFADKI